MNDCNLKTKMIFTVKREKMREGKNLLLCALFYCFVLLGTRVPFILTNEHFQNK